MRTRFATESEFLARTLSGELTVSLLIGPHEEDFVWSFKTGHCVKTSFYIKRIDLQQSTYLIRSGTRESNVSVSVFFFLLAKCSDTFTYFFFTFRQSVKG